jgi:hypothetical protein
LRAFDTVASDVSFSGSLLCVVLADDREVAARLEWSPR